MLKVPSVIDSNVYSTTINNFTSPDGDIRKKYLRIHFVNGEYRDLTNTDIVQESFNFTESLCSSDSLKFGLCEAAEVTFETVGIPNITGCKIQIFYEIDVSDLDATEGCAGRYISDPPEGVDLDEHNCSRTIGDEVERGVYSIPIGIFTVIEAGRSKSDMTHRSIRAITKVFETNDDMSSFELWRIAQMHKKDNFKMKIPHYIDAQLGTIDEKYSRDIIDLPKNDGKVIDCCYKHITNVYQKDAYRKFYIYGTDGSTYNFIFITFTTNVYKDKTRIYFLDNPDNPNSPWIEENTYPYEYYKICNKYTVYNMLNEFDYVYDPAHPEYPYYMIEDISGSFDRFYEQIKRFIRDVFKDREDTDYDKILFQHAYSYFENISNKKKEEFKQYYRNYLSSFGVRYSDKVGSMFSIDESPYIFPYDATMKDDKTTEERTNGRIIIPISIYFNMDLPYDGSYHSGIYNASIKCPNSPVHALTVTMDGMTGPMPYYYRRPDDDDNKTGYDVSLKFNHTLENKSAKTYKYSFYNAFTMRDIINGYLEINAKFGHQARNGKYEYVELPATTTRIMYRSEFEKLYYDEFDIDDIGYVIYKYKKNKNDQEVQVIFDLKNGGTSIYDMTDNSIFSILDENESITDSKLKQKIEKFITDYFKPHLGVIHYYPSEITMHSKPYLEPGDRYEIRNGDGIEDIFYTYNLNQTMSGIQIPKTEMSSTTGMVIDGAALSVDEDNDDDT